jgi:aminoglycoside phosphotransferase (APT) family kinase protein
MAKPASIPHDCEFPQLREILDKEKLAQRLQHRLGPAFASGEMQIEDCKIEQFHYKPGGDCRILLDAKIRHSHDHASERQTFFGALFRAESAQKIFDTLDREHLAQPRFVPAVTHIPEWQMVLWAYPNDPDLPGLSLMVDAERILKMAQAAPEKFGLEQPPSAITAELAKYVPGKRCGHIYRMTLPSSNGHTTNSSFAVYGKAYTADEGDNAYALMKQIWESDACQRGDFALPQPYSYDEKNKILWQEVVSGQPLARCASTISNLPEMAIEIGRRLAAFHGIRLELPQEMTFDFQINEVRQAMAAISETFPQHAESCSDVGQKLLEAAARLGPGILTPVHASFKFSHIFATDKGIAFIDFDGANLGDPGYDLGRFIAHLYKMKAGWKIDPEVADQTVKNFCESYNHAAAAPVPQKRIDWFAASHLLGSQAYKAVKRMEPALVSKLLRIADGLCPT